MNAVVCACSALVVLGGTALQAQVPEHPDNFAGVTTITTTVPFGDARRFISNPSWIGISWEGQWAVRRSLVAGVLLGMHDFFEREDGTMDFPSGSATGEQARQLTMGSLLATTRWFPRGTRWRSVYLGLGAGTIWAQESFQLGVFDPIENSAFHLALVPEAGVVIGIFPAVKGMIGARYTVTAPSGSYLGGGSRSYQYLAITFSVMEH